MNSPTQRDVHHRSADDARLAEYAPSVHDAADLSAVLWRYRWVVLVPAVAGALIGYLFYTQTPVTYQATTRLIVESDRAPMLNSVTGDVIGGVPGIDLVQSQLLGDRIGTMAYQSPAIEPFRADFNNDASTFVRAARGSLRLVPEFSDYQSSQSLVFSMQFKHVDQQLCSAAVRAYSEALQQFFNERQKNSRGELIRLIHVAMEQLYPKMSTLEQQYGDFRRSAPLAWDSSGDAVNPHRERQLYQIQRRREQTEQLRQKQIEAAAIEAITSSAKNPVLALNVIRQALDAEITIPSQDYAEQDLRNGDMALAQIELDRNLVPLMIQRNKFAAQYGDNHPTVKQLDAELGMMKGELTRLVREESKRIVELASEQKQSVNPTRISEAADAINAFLNGTKTEIKIIEDQIKELDAQIELEKSAALEMAQYEQENDAMLREIARTRRLIDQLEEQMARVSLAEEDGGTRVEELTAPTAAHRVGPDLAKTLGMGGFLGLAFGAALALLIEKNANTFRDANQISAYLGVNVLSHIPFYRQQKRATKQGKAGESPDMDASMAVAHEPDSVVAEAIRTLRTSVFFEFAEHDGKVIQITSPLPGDGKSTIAANLACAIAQAGKRVLAIDCDLRRPRLTDNFSLAGKLGLTNVLNGDCDPIEACHESSLEHLDVMPSGPVPRNPAEALTLPRMRETLDLLRRKYDFILLDTPPLLVVTDPSILASMADAVVMALRVRRKSRPNSREALNILRAVGANVLGVVVNNSDRALLGDGYRGTGYDRNRRYASQYYDQRKSKSATGDETSVSLMTVAGTAVAMHETAPSDSVPTHHA